MAPVLVAWTTADGVLSTRDDGPTADVCHTDQVLGAMHYIPSLDFDATV